jgi:hypothetical protein
VFAEALHRKNFEDRRFFDVSLGGNVEELWPEKEESFFSAVAERAR